MKRKGLTKALAIALSVAMVGTGIQPAASTVYAAETDEVVITSNENSDDVASDETASEPEVVISDNSDEEPADEAEETTEESNEEASEELDEILTEEVDKQATEEESWINEKASEFGIEDAASLKEDLENYYCLLISDASEEDIEVSVVELTEKYVLTEEELTDLVNAFAEFFGWEAVEEAVVLVEEVSKAASNLTYRDFTEDTVVAEYSFGKDVTAASVYAEDKGFGFSKVEFNNAAKGWSGSIYYPRVANVTLSDASYVEDANGCLKISSKVWTETESSGYGVYTYENTATFDVDLDNADYTVEVTLTNPTDTEYTAYVEAEDITKASGITVSGKSTVTTSFTACLVDGKLNLKFLANSGATSESAAATQAVYVANVKITRQATNAMYENNGVKKPTVYIASDSTVQSYESYYYPQTGWGQVLAEFMGDGDYEEVTSAHAGYSQSKTYETSTVVVENRAIGGRSSSSFVTEGKLDDLLEDIAAGDYLLIQWGHNDATYSRPNRYVSTTNDTDGNGVADFEQWLQYYIDGAIQRGATPVLVTPVARYSYTADAEGNLISYASNFEAYRQVMVKMSKEQGIALIDLTGRSIDVANTFGIDGGKSLWLWVSAGDYPGGAYAGGASDSTHLQWYGAYKFAQCVAKGLIEAGASSYEYESNISSENKEALNTLAKEIDLRAASQVPGSVTGLTTGTVGASSVSMSWNADNESELYYIYRAVVDSEAAGETYKFTDSSEKYSVSRGTKFTDSNCGAGKTYVYAVRGFNSLGFGEFSENIVVTTKSAGLRFDFNYNNSATQEGWIGINQNTIYDSEIGYGWSKDSYPNNGRSRGNNGTVSADLADMAGDFNLGAGNFCVDLPNGDYEITVYAADLLAGTSTIKTNYVVEGNSIGGCSCKQSLASITAQVRVTDGQMNIETGGTNLYINGLTITELLLAPTSLVETEASVLGNNYSFLIGFNGVDAAAGYNVYRKGTTDADFVLVKTFTLEEYEADELSCRAMACNLGEDYQYYVTCYTSDGTESAPSNTITVSAQLDVATPHAPQNVICVDPSADATEVQNTITISWDVSEIEDSKYPVIKYIVYRSDRAENAKGFVEYKKIAETTETTFTDTDSDLATNVHYYYKVCGSNAGGAGELSEACETPVTGKLALASEETLTDRAVVAIALSDEVKAYATNGDEITEGVYLSWRAFDEDFNSKNKLTTTFDVLCNDKVIATGISVTNLVYEGGKAGDVFLVIGSDDSEIHGGLSQKEVTARDKQYIEYELVKPADQTMPDGSTTSFTANDMSVGDVDGDGELELIVKWYPGNARDNSGSGYTGTTIIDTYDMDWATSSATLMSRIDLGVNIRSGAHYTQFQVWDFDGDGKAEVAVKTADGTTSYNDVLEMVDYVGACDASSLPTDVVSKVNDYRNSGGYVLSGPEYFSIFNLEDGTKAAADVAYTPSRGTVSKWGDAYGNRVDRFLSATAYLDGVHPFAVMCRGYYTRTALTAYGMKDTDNDGIGDTIYELWAYDTDNGDGPTGQGNHNLAVADVDNDGKDEIVYGSSCYDHDGKLKYSTGLGHGDAMHVSDWISWNDGLEVMEVHEEHNQTYQVEIHDAETGEILIGYPVKNADVGRGVAADIDPRSEGAEFWASKAADGTGTGEWDSIDSAVYGTANSSTTYWDVMTAGSTPAVNAMLYWDGDLLAEVQDHRFYSAGYYPLSVVISDWDYENGKMVTLIDSEEILTSNGTKGNLGLIADLTGDWREEFIARCSSDDSHIRVYNTTYVTEYVVPCLLEDLQYREGVAWENVAYNQPTHSSYLLSKGLVTAQITVAEVEAGKVTLNFTAANDGTLYGHEITAYEIYRDGELIDTVSVKDLVSVNGSDSKEEETAPEKPVAPVATNYYFDFGAGAVEEGYTQILANTEYSAEAGYGFLTTSGLSNKAYKNWNDDEKSALYNDCVLGWIANGSSEFIVDVPNGTYDVTFTIANGSGAVYDAVTCEDKNFTDVRRGNSDIQATSETVTVEVTDGQLNVVNSVSKKGYAALYFTALTVVETEESFAAKEAAYEKALAEYEAYFAAKEEENKVDENYGVVKNEYKFDFGAGEVEEGYTQVLADSLYTSEAGYGFKDLTAAGNGKYTAEGNLLSDNVTFYDKSGAEKEFIVDLPNGTYSVEYSVASINCYNAVSAEGASIETNMFRFGSKGGSNTITAEVTVEDGQLNFVHSISKPGYFNIVFSAISIVETEENFANRVAAAKEAYEAAKAEEEKKNAAGYVYTDSNVASNTTYTYTIAAVVDGMTSYKSKEAEATTLVRISEVKDIVLPTIVAGTPVMTDVSELLPQTAIVLDEEGAEQTAAITWNVEAVDLTTAGSYTVYANVAGYAETIEMTLTIIENEVKGVAAIADIKVIVGTEVKLPTTVSVEYTNTTTDVVAVTWDTSKLDVNTIGDYEITGSLEGYDTVAKVLVKVVGDYPVSVEASNIEVAIGDTIVKNLPTTVKAKMASGNTSDIAVTWKTENVDSIDTSAPSDQIIHGTVENLDTDVLCNVYVRYKSLYKFDFGISKANVAEGWTGVTVNAKGGKTTNATLDINYTEARGYGFIGDSNVIEGRTESVTGSGIYPTLFVTDFALMTGQTFVVDVPNGKYSVEVITTCGIGSSSATVDVEGSQASFSCNKSFTVKAFDVEVTDGQLTITDKSTLARIGGVIVRQISVEEEEELPFEERDGKLYYVVDGKVQKSAGLISVNNKFYYVMWTGEVVTDKFGYTIAKTNGLDLEAGKYIICPDGEVLVETGLVDYAGNTYFLNNGAISYGTGVEEYAGRYYYVMWNGHIVKDSFGYKVAKTNGSSLEEGKYIINENGEIVIKSGLVDYDDNTYVLTNGVISYGTGVEEVDGYFYYVMWNGHVVKNSKAYLISKTNESGISFGFHAIDEEGRILTSDGTPYQVQ